MPVVRRDHTMVADAIVENLVEGMPIQQVTRPSRVKLYAVCSVVANASIDVMFGSRTIMTRGSPNLQATAGPTPDDIMVDDIALPGENITLRLEELASGTAIVRYRVEKHAVR